MRRLLRDNGLSLVLIGLFLLFLFAQSLTGWREYNNDQKDHHSKTIGYGNYLTTGHFGEAVFENWESEFLQMSSFVLLTIWLRQRGSSESKKIGEEEEVDKDPRDSRRRKNVPGPVLRGGLGLRIYENSLSLAFVLLFLAAITLHAVEGTRTYNEGQKQHGSPPVSTTSYVTTARFWFESFQNWQSEYLAVGLMVYLSVHLRQKGSPESKPVDAPHDQTGA
jgi:hypothetical protein